MKALEILEESKKIDETPSALGQVGRRVGAAALGAIGMKNTAAGIRGKADLVAKSREYYAAYKKFLGRIGKSEDDADLTDLRDFYIKNGLPADVVPTSGPTDKDTVFKILQKTAADTHRGRSSASRTSTDSYSSRGDDNVPTSASATKLSLDQVQSAVDNLSASEKTQLLKYLQGQPAASPGQVRQAKQAKAAQAAQAQMNTPPAPPAATTPKRSRRRKRKAANVAV